MGNNRNQKMQGGVIMYILTITARRKNAKRHIVDKSTDINDLRKLANNVNGDRYVIEIYTGRWDLVEVIK